jgi:hypothetical protein
MARATIEELSRDAAGRGTPATRRRWLMGKRPGEFAFGYPAKVWEYEVGRATNTLPAAPTGRLVGEWPMTAEQRAFFEE